MENHIYNSVILGVLLLGVVRTLLSSKYSTYFALHDYFDHRDALQVICPTSHSSPTGSFFQVGKPLSSPRKTDIITGTTTLTTPIPTLGVGRISHDHHQYWGVYSTLHNPKVI